MYKVFIESRIIILSKISKNLATKVKYTYSDTLRNSLADIIFNSKENLTIEHENLDELWRDFQSYFKPIIAAGGIVEKNQRFLFIRRNNRWDIPKGKLESGENEEGGAIREIEEECNIQDPKIQAKICDTYHIYELNGKQILKRTAWYHLSYMGNDQLIPQTEEGITEVKWFQKSEFDLIRKDTYGSIIEVLDAFEKLTSS